MFNVSIVVKPSLIMWLIAIASSYVYGHGVARGAEAIIGTAHIIDGDTIEINAVSIRLAGIDACELDQVAQAATGPWACGRAARDYLEGIVGRGPVSCSWTERDQYGRPLARCHAGDRDLNRAMILSGLAVVYRYAGEATAPELVPAEQAARDAGVGLWATIFDTPADHRRRTRR